MSGRRGTGERRSAGERLLVATAGVIVLAAVSVPAGFPAAWPAAVARAVATSTAPATAGPVVLAAALHCPRG